MSFELDPQLVRLAAAPFVRATYIARMERLVERYQLALTIDRDPRVVTMKLLYEHPSALLELASLDPQAIEVRLESARAELANLRAAAPLPPPPERTDRAIALAFADLQHLLFEMRAIRRASRRVPPATLVELYPRRSRDPLEGLDVETVRAIVRVPRGRLLRTCAAIAEVRWGVLELRRMLAPPKPQAAKPELHIYACDAGEVPEGCGRRIEAFGTVIALFKNEGAFYAIDDTCPHRGGPLHQGDIENGAAICPLHGWAFDLKSGVMRGNPRLRVRTFEVQREGEKVYLADRAVKTK